jgi:glycosyltransferase involved in cell wall biosynthesis/SAM-dependent methyltransferase
MDSIALTYYGYVFDASGYGHAARAYVHAFHEAGIKLSVVDLANRAHQVEDPLVESLQHQRVDPDFHLFHGIPPQWARLAFPLRNAIGMTVWETDAMPTQWRNALNHTLEVWLPCEFNVNVFGRALERPVFRLPHPFLPSHTNGSSSPPSFLGDVQQGDFVFYSMFEWQDRKHPHGLLSCYLQTFTARDQTTLIIKTNPGAASAVRAALDEARRQTRSDARVTICPAGWSESQMDALHQRGDCYVSLHRGEGWNYPLFEAAARGKAVIATAYSGPLDYLNPAYHLLVRYQLCSVRQSYLYYNPNMHGADPDLGHACESMRWAYENPQMAGDRASSAAPKIQSDHSSHAIGRAARVRLMELLKRSKPSRWQEIKAAEMITPLTPAMPIPGNWYDEDYFETGVKSNWNQGYTWQLFSGLFRETSNFLTTTFPDASSFLDVGCAKGFLVRSLREAGKESWGFDFSRWAIDHAEDAARPFVECASIDDARFARQFDLLTSFEVFEHLTESQICPFLTRARSWTRMGLLATIPSFQDEQEQAAYHKTDKDLSHVTLRSRQWWHEQFLSAGWRQDPLHRALQRFCQDHELPKRMGWWLYLYAPA